MAKKIELLEHLRKLSGMPPLTEDELANLAEDEEEENEEVLEEAKGKKKTEAGSEATNSKFTVTTVVVPDPEATATLLLDPTLGSTSSTISR